MKEEKMSCTRRLVTEQNRTEVLLDLSIYSSSSQNKIHICESRIHMECTESEKHFQVEGQNIVAFS